MANQVKSARGVTVDFDLLKIKEQIATTPKTTVVQAREDFIDRKFSRRVKKLNKQIVSAQIDVAAVGAPSIIPTFEELDESEFEDSTDDSIEGDIDQTEQTSTPTPAPTRTRRKL